ncbi:MULTISPECIES: hypothetical protein [Thermoactinomyces]|jgi:uncharacterized protein YggL (DUF469 family)|uniref:Uncharacterized protein n=1 Tax=Thermoactinomyces daqus TaxID=1329516 RepID=A0A7W2AIA5_9BACL|nr:MULTISPECIES: hypothetical protein [Thermoactinomyces]MBA4543060.1 hypothetical protein [Thermoactinomyces daqus]MBH8605532.1 hypothetical protein [Thermoactinomyces sp. CICC 10522]MBH8608781.1 hypothetical protein [Thermoactinomyces sp. CICC 10521]
MRKKKQIGIHIDGCIFANDKNTDIDHDEFLDKFIAFVEENGWLFGGGTKRIDEDGDLAEHC